MEAPVCETQAIKSKTFMTLKCFISGYSYSSEMSFGFAGLSESNNHKVKTVLYLASILYFGTATWFYT